MITSDQKTQACILLNKLKLLISEAAYVSDLKSLYTAIESEIDNAGAGGEGEDSSSAAEESCTSISITWYQSKITLLKTEIQKTLTEITTQISNNI